MIKKLKTSLKCNKPTFIDSIMPEEVSTQWQQSLALLNADPSPLISYISKRKTRRVGFYYESLVSFLISHFEGLKLITEHLQIQEKGKTLGEIDFIYQDQNTLKVAHLETAVKFYLGVESRINQESIYKHWIGPMIQDRLDLKLSHLINHQTKITQQSAFSTMADQLNLHLPLTQEVLLQGYLFQHPLENTTQPFDHENKSPNLWLKLGEIDEFLPQASKFIILEKPFWLGQYHDKKSNQLLSIDLLKAKIQQLIEKWNRPVLVSIIPISNIAQQEDNTLMFQESNRCFIVPDNWAGIISSE
jgi:hypothetical protein